MDCLHRVMVNGLPQHQFEILVVDNASSDGTPDLVAENFPEITLVRLSKNGGAVAKNVAIRKARGEFVVVLDDDAFPHAGAVQQMVRHFREDEKLAAAVFDVMLLDGTKEAAAYPDVFIGAGTGFRKSVLDRVGLFPHDFFMQAEEYDLSFRILEAGYSVRRFEDMPLTHLKSPDARTPHRITGLDTRNNLYLLAKYIPAPLCHQLAADWLTRYFMMAAQRDAQGGGGPHPVFGSHRKCYLKGAAQGFAEWGRRRANGKHLLAAETIERIFKFKKIKARMEQAVERVRGRRVIFADFGKNMLAYYLAAKELGVEVLAINDDKLAAPGTAYRGVPILHASSTPWSEADIVIVSNLSPVQAPPRAAALKRSHSLPVVDLFSHHGIQVNAHSKR